MKSLRDAPPKAVVAACAAATLAAALGFMLFVGVDTRSRSVDNRDLACATARVVTAAPATYGSRLPFETESDFRERLSAREGFAALVDRLDCE